MKISKKRLKQIILEEMDREDQTPDPGIDQIIGKISDPDDRATLRLYINDLKNRAEKNGQ